MKNWNEDLRLELETLFMGHGLSVAVGLTKKGVAIRSQDERVDALNLGGVKALTPERLKSLEESEAFLDALQAAGVDNWEGYSEAFRILDGEEI